MSWKASAPVLLVLASATLLWLSFQPAQGSYCAWVALLPLFLLLRSCAAGTAWVASQVAGGVFSAGIQWWQLGVPALGIPNFVLGHLVISAGFGLFGLLAWHFHRKIPRWSVLTFPATWVVLEYLRTHAGLLSWPWGILGYAHSQKAAPLAVASYTGVYGVSFLVVLANAALAGLVRWPPAARSARSERASRPGRAGALAALLAVPAILLVAGAGAGEPNAGTAAEQAGLRVSLIQGNAAIETSTARDEGWRVFKIYQDLTRSVADEGPSLIVWPSSTVPGTLPSERKVTRELADLARASQAHLLVGASGFDKLTPGLRERKEANSAFLFSPEGRIAGRYDKMKLLPFDEYYPLRGLVRWPSWLISPTREEALAGKEYAVLRLGEHRFSVLICWENYFPEHFREMALRGADFIVSQTNETFTGSSTARHQMLAMNAFRAAENGIYILRAAPTGVSAVIAPTGAVAQRVADGDGRDVDLAGTLTATIQHSGRRPFYHRHGNLFFWGVLAFFAAAALAAGLSPGPRGEAVAA